MFLANLAQTNMDIVPENNQFAALTMCSLVLTAGHNLNTIIIDISTGRLYCSFLKSFDYGSANY